MTGFRGRFYLNGHKGVNVMAGPCCVDGKMGEMGLLSRRNHSRGIPTLEVDSANQHE